MKWWTVMKTYYLFFQDLELAGLEETAENIYV